MIALLKKILLNMDVLKELLNKMKRLVFFVLSIIFCVSCSSQNRTDIPLIKILNINYEVITKIPQSGLISDLSNYVQPYGANYIIFYNEKNNVFSKLDFSTMELTKICKIKDKSDYWNWYYDDKNSIFYVVYERVIIKYNVNGNITERKNLPEFKEGFFEKSNIFFRPLINNEDIYFYFLPKVNGNYKNPDLYTSSIEGKINLKTKKHVKLNQQYPFNYQQHCYGLMYAPQRIKIGNTQHGYLFSYNDSIFVYDITTGYKFQHYLGTHQKKVFKYLDFNEISKLNETIFDELMYSNPFYYLGGFAYYSKLYYRTILFPENKQDAYNQINEINQTQLEQTCRKFEGNCILVLYDSNFKYIGESNFMDAPGFIVDSKDGLLSLISEKGNIIIRKIVWK